MTVTATNLSGERERISLPAPHYQTERRGQQDFTGIWILALYSGPRTGRRFALTYSQWDNGKSQCVGDQYNELSEDEYLDYCERVDCEPKHVPATQC